MQVCGTSGKRRAYPRDNKVLPVCCTSLPHNVRSKGPIYWKLFPPPTICSQRNQAVPSSCTHTVMPTYHTLNSETSEGKWSPLAITDPDYVMLWAACCLEFFGFMRAGEFTVTSSGESDSASYLCTSDIFVDCHENPSMVCVVLH